MEFYIISFSGRFFCFVNFVFCIDVAMCDQVHNVETVIAFVKC